MWVTIGTAAPVVATATAVYLGAASSRLRDGLPGLEAFVEGQVAKLRAEIATYGSAAEEIQTEKGRLADRLTEITAELISTKNPRRRTELDADFARTKAAVLALHARNAESEALRPNVEQRTEELNAKVAYTRLLRKVARSADLVVIGAFLSCSVATLLSVLALSAEKDIVPRALGIVLLCIPLFSLLITPIAQVLIDMNRFTRERASSTL